LWFKKKVGRPASAVRLTCPVCGNKFIVKKAEAKRRKCCSKQCSRHRSRKTTRPDHNILVIESESMSLSEMGRKYGVSGNSIKKWLAI
jgi:uncharacterized Zn finger protein (UPF0148 family)